MSIRAWQLVAQQPVEVSLSQWNQVSRTLRHLDTAVHADSNRPRTGQAVWGTENDSKIVGIAWDWCEVREGIVALSEPMFVQSNVVLLDHDGQLIDDALRVRA